ncbi:hypothetical protein Glove_405g6 [Diversispora epigaea]|uniref:Uncharacterized protein n=1 Tax=Diversispora epigaea TaxID=1348612 RepID=A0A397GZV7_9GLOM|nr:hypothetical protein Glove_405g6 [Diversispora epigaea]
MSLWSSTIPKKVSNNIFVFLQSYNINNKGSSFRNGILCWTFLTETNKHIGVMSACVAFSIKVVLPTLRLVPPNKSIKFFLSKPYKTKITVFFCKDTNPSTP